MISFEGHIQGDIPVLVDFYAAWCGPCKLMPPILQEVKRTVGDRVTVLKIDIDANPGYAQQYQVYSVPTLILFHKGNILWRKSGVASAHEIIQQLGVHVAV
jgi:thioredoxin 1